MGCMRYEDAGADQQIIFKISSMAQPCTCAELILIVEKRKEQEEANGVAAVGEDESIVVGANSSIRCWGQMKDGCVKELLGHEDKVEQAAGESVFKEKSTAGFYEDFQKT